MNNKIPPKIKNLFWLKDQGIKVPFFFVIDENAIKNINLKIKEIINFYHNKEVESVIIRSASCCEDSDKKSRAGFFRSTREILLKDLNAEKVLELWLANKRKAEQINCSSLYIFVQQYFRADYTSVLFSQQIYDQSVAKLMLSASPDDITSGKEAEKSIIYNKENDWWIDQNFLSECLRRKLSRIVFIAEKKFSEGADIELGIKGNNVEVYQIRPINRNRDEKILLSEKRRLKNIFGGNFEKQLWTKNAFAQSLGDVEPLSLSFYNELLNSRELYSLLKTAKIIGKKKCENIKYRILENIGGCTFYNTSQEKLLFSSHVSWWENFKKAVFITGYENIMQEKSSKLLSKELSISHSFAYFFLSGIYLQIFIGKEKQKYNNKSFVERFRNTEIICNASNPYPQGTDSKSIAEFIEKYYYWANSPYKLANPRISEQDKKEIAKKYTYFNAEDKQANPNKCLGKKVRFWLRQKVLWKQKFLKLLLKERKRLIQRYGEDIFKVSNSEGIVKKNEKLSDLFLTISGKHYPYSKQEEKKLIIMPGEIDFKNVICLIDRDDIRQYTGRYIAIRCFPNDWIPFIPKLKGIVLKEGNELSHMAITCREHKIPCRIVFSFFKDYK